VANLYSEGEKNEFFDLKNDSWELDNKIDNSNYQEVIVDMR
jgi:hypothetical protein